MSGERRFLTGPEEAGERLDRVVVRHLPELSRSAVAALVRGGHVAAGGRTARKPGQPVRAGEEVRLALPPPPPRRLEPDPIPLRVLHEDEEILVVDKPAGLVVHPAAGHARGTLVNALLARAGELAPGAEPERAGVVHRLDKDTSGCLVVARTARARASLEAQFRERRVRKRYLAVVHGHPPPAGTIELAIGRDPRRRKRMSVRAPRGRPATSRYRVLERLPGASLVEVTIATGRTHQIRVHLASLGHPVVGDELYGGRRRGAGPIARFGRQALHAAELGFEHPATGRALTFHAPLPMDLEDLLRALRSSVEPPGERGKRVLG